MANEITYSGIGDLRATHILHRELAYLLHDPTDLRAVCTELPGDVMGSATLKVPQLDVDYAMSAPGEATQINNTAMVDGSYTLQVAHYSIQFEETYLSTLTAPAGGYDIRLLAQELVQRTGLTMTNIIAALFPSITAAVTDTGVDLTVDHIYDAMFTLRAASVPGPYYCVLYPVQLNDFLASLRGETGAMQWQPSTADMLALKGPGYQGTWNNVEFWSSDSVTSVNAGADSSGCMFGAGAFAYREADVTKLMSTIPPEALIPGLKCFAQLGQIQDYGMQRLTAHYFPAAAIAENARGVEIITDR